MVYKIKEILFVFIGVSICANSFAEKEEVQWTIKNNLKVAGKELTVKHDDGETVNLQVQPKSFKVPNGASKVFSVKEVSKKNFNEMTFSQEQSESPGWAVRFKNDEKELYPLTIGKDLAITYNNNSHEIFFCSIEDFIGHNSTCRYTEDKNQTSQKIKSDINVTH